MKINRVINSNYYNNDGNIDDMFDRMKQMKSNLNESFNNLNKMNENEINNQNV